MPEPSRWDQISELLAEAGSVVPEEREEFLRAKTADAGLRAEVLSLLGVSMPTGDILERPAMEWYRPEIASTGPAETQPRLMAGELVAGRFAVQAFLGRGGMGEVYSAEDRELHERVALKLLYPQLADQPGFLDRFRREIRLARRIAHPNVARVFDLIQEPGHRNGDLYFYVLELLDGETLGARLKREGALPEAEALQIARQMAAGLAAVHAAGVLHRDFKPANVILAEGRAVLTDFGLAAPIVRETGEAALQTTSLLLGTPGYVAPEQWAGKAATVETDVYAFGIVLHEMITGRHPNAEGAKLEGDWGRVVAKCLELDPAKRWNGPVEAVAGLVPGMLTRRNVLMGVAGASVAAGGGWGTWRLLNRVRPPAGAKLMVGEVRNSTGDARFDAVGTALRMHLEQSTFLNIVQAGDLSQTLSSMVVDLKQRVKPEQYREAAWRMNAAGVVFGSFDLLGASPTLTLQVEWRGKQPQEPSAQDTKSFSARGWGDVSQTVREAGNWVRASVGDISTASAIYDRTPEQVTTPSWEALLYFARADAHAYVQRQPEALLELESALRVDPGFSFAAMRKADILNSMGRDLESMRAWESAMRLLQARPVSRREELRTLGMYHFDTHSFKESEDQFAKLSYEYPNDARGYFYRSTQMLMDGRARELIPVLQRAAELDSGYFSTYTALGQVGALLGDSAMVDQAVNRLDALDKRQYGNLSRTTQGWMTGDLSAVVKNAKALQRLESARFRCEGSLQEANVYAEAGLTQRAAAIFEHVAAELNDASTAGVRARALTGAGYCSMDLPKRIPLIVERLCGVQESVNGYAHAAVLLAGAGELGAAHKYLRQLEDCPDVQKTRIGMTLATMEIARAEGNDRKAEEARHQLIQSMPKYGPHAWLMHNVDGAGGNHEPGLAAAPVYFWLHTHHYRAGEWGKVLRGMRMDGTGVYAVRRQLQKFRESLETVARQEA